MLCARACIFPNPTLQLRFLKLFRPLSISEYLIRLVENMYGETRICLRLFVQLTFPKSQIGCNNYSYISSVVCSLGILFETLVGSHDWGQKSNAIIESIRRQRARTTVDHFFAAQHSSKPPRASTSLRSSDTLKTTPFLCSSAEYL